MSKLAEELKILQETIHSLQEDANNLHNKYIKLLEYQYETISKNQGLSDDNKIFYNEICKARKGSESIYIKWMLQNDELLTLSQDLEELEEKVIEETLKAELSEEEYVRLKDEHPTQIQQIIEIYKQDNLFI
jgi:hypothetical protein